MIRSGGTDRNQMTRAQLEMFAGQDDLYPAEPVVYRADPDRVRRKLERILAEARAADTMPWDNRKQALYRQIFPQMTLWLPEEEAAQLRLDFESEMERLG
jgi:hypothetical protein